MLEIGDEKFLDEDYDVTVGDGAIVLTSWSDGHTHLYLYSYNEAKPLAADAKLEGQLTHGDFEVSGVYSCRPRAKIVTYASNEGNPLEQQIWEVDFNGERRQLSAGAGFHDANFAPNGNAFADNYSTRTADAGGPALPRRGRSCFGRELPRLLGDPRARCLPCASAGAIRDESARWNHALRHVADAFRRNQSRHRAAHRESLRRTWRRRRC